MFHHKPNSVYAIIYLSSLLPGRSSGTSRAPKGARDTALHLGKDLAVSLPPFKGIIPDSLLIQEPEPFGIGVTVRTSAITDDGRYPLPCCFLQSKCSDFPLARVIADSCERLLDGAHSLCIIYLKFQV